MNTRRHFSFLCLALLLLATTPAYATKRALIIANGNYSFDKTGWLPISSGYDVAFVDTMLVRQKFAQQDIRIVRDADKKAMKKALADLVASAGTGDIVMIHISSHGVQIQDNNAPEEADGLDEAIVPIDAISPIRAAEEQRDFAKVQEAYLRDDEFGEYIQQLRAKLGSDGDVIVFIDACHSGSATRGDAKIRGGQPPLVDKDFKRTGNKDQGVFLEGKAQNATGLAAYVVLSAAEAHEPNLECQDDDHHWMGSLTYAMSKSFASLDQGQTYRGLFGKVQGVMLDKVPNQKPVLEGNGKDRELFGGKFVAQQSYVEIGAFVDATTIRVKSGRLHGLMEGAKVKLYAAGTADPTGATAMAEGTVEKSENFSATIKLNSSTGWKNGDALPYVFITEAKYDNAVTLKVITTQNLTAQVKARGFHTTFTQAEADAVTSGIQDLAMIKIASQEQPDLILVKGPVKDSLLTGNGDPYLVQSLKSSDLPALRKSLTQYAQYKFLKELDLKDDRINVEVSLVPVKNGKPDTNAASAKSVNGRFEVAEGDTLVLWVKNNSDMPVAINVLDLQPDGIINKILPNSRPANGANPVLPESLKFKARSSQILNNYKIFIYPPYGIECFKIFASSQSINLEDLATVGDPTTGGVSTSRGNLNILETIVATSRTISTRGGGLAVGDADASTQDLIFTIKKK